MKFRPRLFTFCALAFSVIRPASAQVSITTWQADNSHSGSNTNETRLSIDSVSTAGNFGLVEFGTVDAQSYGQPLVLSAVKLSDGTTHDMVYVGTQNASLFAFDSATTNQTNATAPLQSIALNPSPSTLTAVKQGTGVGDISFSGDITPLLGMTTTPVIDPATNTIYAVSKLKNINDNSVHQYIYAVDLTSFQPKFGTPLEITATFPGNANSGDPANPDSVNNVITFNAYHQHLRASMVLFNGVVYLGYASHSDTNPYHGLILAYGYDGQKLKLVNSFIDTPVDALGAAKGAGIWGAGAGPAIDANGMLYVSTANGAWDHTSAAATTYGGDWGESILKMDTSKPFTVDYTNTNNWFTPYNWDNLNGGDLDLGSGGLLLLPDQTGGTHKHIMVGGGKAGVLYVVDRDSLGGLHNPDAVIQEIPEATHAGANGAPVVSGLFGTPAYFNGSLYYAGSGLPLEQRKVGYNSTNGSYISDPPIFSSAGGYNNRSCFLSSKPDLTDGIAWVTSGGTLDAYDASNVSKPQLVSARMTVPPSTGVQNCKFTIPVVANGRVYCTGYDSNNVGHLLVFGLLPTPSGSPSAASNATSTAISASSVLLSWADNSSNESGFKIQRSTNATSGFATVATVGSNVTSYTDSSLAASTTYYYHIVATNSAGDANATGTPPATTFPTYAESGLVAYWNMDELSGQVSHDTTGHGHNGSNVGETYFAQKNYINGTVHCHGTGEAPSEIVVGNKADLQFAATGSFTVALWVNADSFTTTEQAIFAKSRDQGNYYGVWLNANHQLVGRGTDGTNPVDIVSPDVMTAQTWTHVALVQDGAARKRFLYVNGVLKATGNALAADGAGDLWMAEQNVSGNVEAIQCYLDEVRLYNRALAATEIPNLMGPPVLGAQSLLAHGSNGTFGATIWPAVPKRIEPRKGSPVGTYNVTLHFSAPVTGFKIALQNQGGGTPSSGNVGQWTYTDSTQMAVSVPLTGVQNLQALNIHVSGISPGNGAADIPFNVLWGDVNGDNVVNAQDQAIVSKNAASSVNALTALYDINCDGAVDVSDSNFVTPLEGNNLGAESVTNLALCSLNTLASSHNGGNIVDAAFDIYPRTTRWESEQKVDPEWIMVDLGTPANIQQVVLNWETSSGKQYNIDVSTDSANPDQPNATNWQHLAQEAANTHGNGAGTDPHPPYVNALPGAFRYVRMYGISHNGNYGYSLWDFQVLGTAGTTTPTAVPVVTGGSLTLTENTAIAPYQVQATNSPTSYAATGLPTGLSIPDLTKGVISGTPTVTGTFAVTLTAKNGVGTSNAATLNLTVQTPFAAWQSQYFTAAELQNSNVSGPNATPAGDGMSNLLKYALNLDPKTSGVAGLPTVSTTAAGGKNYLTLIYTKVISATDITYTAEVSPDLATWTSGTNATVAVSTTNNADGKTQTVVVRDATATDAAVKRFLHLKVTSP